MSVTFNDSAWRRKLLQNEYTIPTRIGFRVKGDSGADFKHGLVKEFFKFFYMDGDQPIGNFKDMADVVHDKGYDIDDELAKVGEQAQEIHDYLKPQSGLSPHNLNNMTQDNAAEFVYDYMDKANKLAKKIHDSVVRGGAAKKSQVVQGLKGLVGTLKRAKNIFTSSFGPPKARRIGFRFGDK